MTQSEGLGQTHSPTLAVRQETGGKFTAGKTTISQEIQKYKYTLTRVLHGQYPFAHTVLNPYTDQYPMLITIVNNHVAIIGKQSLHKVKVNI